MLICGDCSARNNDGERFCSNCGAYLVWQRTPAEAEEPRPMPTGSSTNLDPDVTTAQLPIVPGPSDTRHAASPVTASRDLRNSVPSGGAKSGAHVAGNARVGAPESIGGTATGDAATHGAGLQERQPGKEGDHAPYKATPQAPHDEPPQFPGGLICRRCGAGNKPDVHFCRQCGAGLEETAPAPPLPPWWQQILGRTKPPALPAGTRPRWRIQRRFPVGAVSLLTVLGLFCGVAYLGRGVIAAAMTRVVDEISEEKITVQDKDASSSKPGRGADLAFDGSERSWASRGPAQAGVDYLKAGFGPPFRLTYVVIFCAASGVDQDPGKEQKPVKAEIVAVRGDGARASLTVDLSGCESGPKNFYFGADQTSTVMLRILDSAGPTDGPVSVEEVQFFGRR
ncbi:hypothetical protein SRABI26_00259 [Arthrobacter sp. Bi26]|nr:hypothetical protein SRABI26_00259 [Arthrobacter sp. Bi26]